jgi:hypothetical protein
MKLIVSKVKRKPLKQGSKAFYLDLIPWMYEVYGLNKVIAYGYAHSKEQAIGSGLNLAEEMRDSKGYYKGQEIDVIVK